MFLFIDDLLNFRFSTTGPRFSGASLLLPLADKLRCGIKLYLDHWGPTLHLMADLKKFEMLYNHRVEELSLHMNNLE
jgi:hypothetical protein